MNVSPLQQSWGKAELATAYPGGNPGMPGNGGGKGGTGAPGKKVGAPATGGGMIAGAAGA